MKATTAVISLSCYLLTYTVLASMGAPLALLTCLYLFSPFLLIAMVYIVLKDNRKKYPLRS